MNKPSQKEMLDSTDRSIVHIEHLLNTELSVHEFCEIFPGGFHINSIDDCSLKFFNKPGEELYDCTYQEVAEKGLKIMKDVVHPEDLANLSSRLIDFVTEQNVHTVISFFQRLKRPKKIHYDWYFTSCKMSRFGLISVSHPIKRLESYYAQVAKILEDGIFVKKNFKKFMSLTKREKEILVLLATGNTSPQIGEMLFISQYTVNKHRQNIFNKLEVKTYHQLYLYAFHFDLLP